MKRDFTAKTQRAQRIIFFPLPLRGRQRKSNVLPGEISLRSPRLCGENRVEKDHYPYF